MRISDWSSDVCSSDLPGSRLSDRLAAGTPAATISTHPTGNIMARILIVDDSPSQLMGIRRIVEKLGHEALTAESSEERHVGKESGQRVDTGGRGIIYKK